MIQIPPLSDGASGAMAFVASALPVRGDFVMPWPCFQAHTSSSGVEATHSVFSGYCHVPGRSLL
jgi:hypothetical protein